MSAQTIQPEKNLGNGLYEVQSESVANKTYVVDLRDKGYTCKGFQYRGSCKHLRALQEREDEASVKELREQLNDLCMI